jgi:hypothetical protein
VEDQKEATDRSRKNTEAPSRHGEAGSLRGEQRLSNDRHRDIRDYLNRVGSLIRYWPQIAGLIGLVLYVIGRAFTDIFYEKYGLTPEEVGIDLPYLVLRVVFLVLVFIGGIIVIFCVGLVVALVIEWIFVSLLRRRPWRRFFLALVVGLVAVASGAFGYLTYLRPLPPEAEDGILVTTYLGFGCAMLLLGLLPLRRRRPEAQGENRPEAEGGKRPEAEGNKSKDALKDGVRAFIGFVGIVLVLGGVGSLWRLPFSTADQSAARLDKGKPVELTLWRWPLFQVESFRVASVGPQISPVADQCAFLLGTSGSTTFLYNPAVSNPAARRVWRLPSASIGLSRSRTGECS